MLFEKGEHEDRIEVPSLHVALDNFSIRAGFYDQKSLLSLGGACCWPTSGLPEPARACVGDGISIKN